MALAEQLDTVGANLTEPMRHRIVDGSGSVEAALDELMAECARAHPGCRLSVQRDEGFGVAVGERAVHLHRAVQEALSFLVSCSDASEAAVHLQLPDGSELLRVRITDNGRGEDSDSARERLAQMHDGLATCGGKAELARLPGGGHCLTLSVPAKS
jgi:signal transduction histidine kinase